MPAADPVDVKSWREGSVVINMVQVFYRKGPHGIIILHMSTLYTLALAQKGEKEAHSGLSAGTIHTKKPPSLDENSISLGIDPNGKANGLRRGKGQRQPTQKFVDIKKYHPNVKFEDTGSEKIHAQAHVN